MTTVTGLRTCSKCGTEKPLDDFYVNRCAQNGSSKKPWAGPRPECIACHKTINAERYQRKREQYDATKRRWSEKNPDRHDFSKAQTGARTRGATEFMSFPEWLDISKATECHWCGLALHRSFRNIDHIRPLAFGGQHTADNVVMTCANCNMRREWERKTKGGR